MAAIEASATLVTAALAVATLAVSTISNLGCTYSADHSDTQYLCSGQGECPEPFKCQTGVCRLEPVDAGVESDATEPDGSELFTCPAECTQIAGLQLCYCSTLADFETGRRACVAAGLRLAQPDTPELSQALGEYITAVGPEARGFVGGTDLVIEGEWRWLRDNSLFWTGLADGSAPVGVFTDWADPEPNQFEDREEDCLQAVASGWNDIVCTQLRASYCGR